MYSVEFDIDMLPPSTNHLYKSIGGARKALTDDAHTFRELVALALRGRDCPPAGAIMALSIWITFGSRRRQDADNRGKWVTDCVATVLGFDDSRIHEWHIYRVDGPRDWCRVCLEVIDVSLNP